MTKFLADTIGTVTYRMNRRGYQTPCAWCQRAGDLELALEAVRNHESDSLDRLVAAAEQIMTEWRKRRWNNVSCGSQRQP